MSVIEAARFRPGRWQLLLKAPRARVADCLVPVGGTLGAQEGRAR